MNGVDFAESGFDAMKPFRVFAVLRERKAAPWFSGSTGARERRVASRMIGPWTLAGLSLALVFPASSGWAASHGLVVGIDAYQHVQTLRGATADARDIDKALRGIGVADVRLLLDGEANRKTILAAFEALVAATRPGDTVFIALAGHGAQEPERVRGSEPDGMEEVFLLQRFDPKDPEGASEKILDKEFNHYINKIEASGGRVIFVADTCSGGGLARGVDPRGADLIYRSVTYAPIKDRLVSVAERADSFASTSDFKRSLFLAAVDKRSRVPEVKIPGSGYRGGLSYAFARAIEGAADVKGDGKITAEEIFNYVRQTAHQLSDQRQVVVLEHPAQEEPGQDVVVELTRGIAVRPVDPAPANDGGLTISSVDQPLEAASPPSRPLPAAPLAAISPTPSQPISEAPAKPRPAPPRPAGPETIRVASLNGQNALLADLQRQATVTLVAPNANPDLVWDPRTSDVLEGADVIARNISVADLPGVVERTIALNRLKQRAARSAQAIRLLPSDELHTKGTRIEIEVDQLTDRYLVLFNLSGNGNVQLLYPLGSDSPQRRDPKYGVEFQVREPYGADLIIAVTANQRLTELERLLRQSSRQISPERLADVLSKGESQALRVGYVGVFTAP
jgi:hypothetical protein